MLASVRGTYKQVCTDLAAAVVAPAAGSAEPDPAALASLLTSTRSPEVVEPLL